MGDVVRCWEVLGALTRHATVWTNLVTDPSPDCQQVWWLSLTPTGCHFVFGVCERPSWEKVNKKEILLVTLTVNEVNKNKNIM
jgi:hypothetical protein